MHCKRRFSFQTTVLGVDFGPVCCGQLLPTGRSVIVGGCLCVINVRKILSRLASKVTPTCVPLRFVLVFFLVLQRENTHHMVLYTKNGFFCCWLFTGAIANWTAYLDANLMFIWLFFQISKTIIANWNVSGIHMEECACTEVILFFCDSDLSENDYHWALLIVVGYFMPVN